MRAGEEGVTADGVRKKEVVRMLERTLLLRLRSTMSDGSLSALKNGGLPFSAGLPFICLVLSGECLQAQMPDLIQRISLCRDIPARAM